MKYEEYAESLGFTKEGNVYIKEENGFQIYLKDFQYMVLTIPSFYIPLNKSLDHEEIKRMEIASLNNAVFKTTLSQNGDTLIVTLADGNKGKEKTQQVILEQITKVTEVLAKDGYQKMETCPICKKEASYSVFGDQYCPMHDACRASYIEKLHTLANQNKGFKKSYIFAFFLSILGISIGLTPAFLFGYFTYDYFAALLCLAPILSTLGVFLSHAPNKKWLRLAIGSLVMISILLFLSFMIPYMAKGKNLSIVEYMFTGKWLGFRKLLFGILLSMGGFGGMKFLKKFQPNYEQELKKFNA